MNAMFFAFLLVILGIRTEYLMPVSEYQPPEIQVELAGNYVVENVEKHFLKISDGTQIELVLPGKMDVTQYIGKHVVIKGTLTITKEGSAGNHVKLSCRVVQIQVSDSLKEATDKKRGKMDQQTQIELVAALRKSGQMLVLYERGKGASVVELCKSLGLEVKEIYGAGNYIVCKWKVDADLMKITKVLLGASQVRSIEPNRTIDIDPK